MHKIKIAKTYSENYLEIDRPQPLSDNKIEHLIKDVLTGNFDIDLTDSLYQNFIQEVENVILNSKLNTITGLEKFARKDIIIGCTQFIDNIYMKGPVQTIINDYRYHERLSTAYINDVGNLIPNVPLIIAMPFPQIGAPHKQMHEILEEATAKNIDVHVDGAWISCCRDISFDFNHHAIKSVGISLSKGFGLGWNRIGVRWSNNSKHDSITIMNDFKMNNRALVLVGLHFIKELGPDYLWLNHKEHYYKVCRDFHLTPTNSIYLAMRNTQPVGISPLLRYLENENLCS